MRIRSVNTQRVAILEHKRNLNDPDQPRRHQRVSKHGMNLLTERQVLRMSRHAPASQHDHQRGDQIALRLAVALSAQPHAQQARAPPDNPHSRVLQIVVHPGMAPAMLRKSVDAAPGRDDSRIEELLAPAGAPQPVLAHQQEDGEQDAVRDERAAHDEVRQALPQVITPAEPLRGDAAKEHLYPADHRHRLPEKAVRQNKISPHPPVDASLQMQLQIHAQPDLHDHHKHQRVGKHCVNVLGELSPLVRMAEEIREDGNDGADNLHRDMPTRSSYLNQNQPTLPRTMRRSRVIPPKPFQAER